MILANLSRFVQHARSKMRVQSGLTTMLLILLVLSLAPALAQEAAPEAATAQSAAPGDIEPAYISGRVTEIISETSVKDEAFQRDDKKFRFKVYFPAQNGAPEETVLLEQVYTANDAPEKLPAKGKRFIFYKEAMVDGTHSYVMIDVQRLNHFPWIVVLVIIALVLCGRWFGIKAVLIGGGMLACFLLFHFLKFPWMLNSLLTFITISAAASLLTFGTSPRFVASLVASLLGGVVILLLVWMGGLMGVSSPSVLFGSGMILQMAAGLSYIAISTVTAIHLSTRSDPTLSRQALFQKGSVGGRGSIEVVVTLYLVITIGQILTSVYSQGGELNLLQMEPVLTEMASLLFMLLGFALALPLSAFVGAQMVSKKK